MGVQSLILNNPGLKSFVHALLVNKSQSRPWWYVDQFINPFLHRKSRKSVIRGSVRKDLFPFNQFQMGAKSIVEDFSTLNNGVGDIVIGANTLIGMGNVLIGPISIGDNCIFAQNIVCSGLNHNFEDVETPIRDQGVNKKLITIGDDCWIGANATITQGVTIGKHSVIGAGSVVTKDVPDYHIAVGNPAKLVKKYDLDQKEWVRL